MIEQTNQNTLKHWKSKQQGSQIIFYVAIITYQWRRLVWNCRANQSRIAFVNYQGEQHGIWKWLAEGLKFYMNCFSHWNCTYTKLNCYI